MKLQAALFLHLMHYSSTGVFRLSDEPLVLTLQDMVCDVIVEDCCVGCLFLLDENIVLRCLF